MHMSFEEMGISMNILFYTHWMLELWLYEKMWIGFRTLFYTHRILEQWSFEDTWKLLKELCLKFKWHASVCYLCKFTLQTSQYTFEKRTIQQTRNSLTLDFTETKWCLGKINQSKKAHARDSLSIYSTYRDYYIAIIYI